MTRDQCFQLYDPCSCLAVRVNVRSINKQRLAFDQHLSEVCDLGRAPVITRPQTDAYKDRYTLAIRTHTLLTSWRARQTTKAPLGMPVARTWEITKQSDLQNDIIALWQRKKKKKNIEEDEESGKGRGKTDNLSVLGEMCYYEEM